MLLMQRQTPPLQQLHHMQQQTRRAAARGDQPSWFFIDYRWRQCTLAAVPCSTNWWVINYPISLFFFSVFFLFSSLALLISLFLLLFISFPGTFSHFPAHSSLSSFFLTKFPYSIHVKAFFRSIKKCCFFLQKVCWNISGLNVDRRVKTHCAVNILFSCLVIFDNLEGESEWEREREREIGRSCPWDRRASKDAQKHRSLRLISSNNKGR